MNKRSWLEQRFNDLYVGQLEDIDEFDNDKLEDLVDALELLQAYGLLNLETEQGLSNLADTIERIKGE